MLRMASMRYVTVEKLPMNVPIERSAAIETYATGWVALTEH
jgi:hypothetical protein